MIITSKFDGRCKSCGGSIKVGDRVNWERGVAGVTHALAMTCEAVRAAVTIAKPVTPVQIDGSPIVKFLLAAQERGLKYPKARFLAPDRKSELRLSVAGETSKFPGSVQVKLDGIWLGRIEPSGYVAGRLVNESAILATLATVAADPAKAAKEYGAVMGRCSFCDKSLTDEGSVEVGYGPVCARKYGLPHKPKGTKELVEVAA